VICPFDPLPNGRRAEPTANVDRAASPAVVVCSTTPLAFNPMFCLVVEEEPETMAP
jgi:hypothetical protein